MANDGGRLLAAGVLILSYDGGFETAHLSSADLKAHKLDGGD
jgi:hypothetical protein